MKQVHQRALQLEGADRSAWPENALDLVSSIEPIFALYSSTPASVSTEVDDRCKALTALNQWL